MLAPLEMLAAADTLAEALIAQVEGARPESRRLVTELVKRESKR
jgi:hypothetical protein